MKKEPILKKNYCGKYTMKYLEGNRKSASSLNAAANKMKSISMHLSTISITYA